LVPSHNIVTLDAAGRPTAQGLQVTGPRLPVEIHVPPAWARHLQQNNLPVPAPQTGEALIDTGATVSVVDAAAVQALGINPVGVTGITGVTGQQQTNLYPATFAFPGANLPDINFASVTASALQPMGLVALIGRDILLYFTMFYNGPLGIVTLSI
jgi:predicted aspartyl protease